MNTQALWNALVWWMVSSMALAALAAVWAALNWAGYVREMRARARRQEARMEARRLAPICEAELGPGARYRTAIVDRLAARLEQRGFHDADDLAGDAVTEMLTERQAD